LLISNDARAWAMQTASLSSSQKTEILRRQAFKCAQCQTDLEPVGRAPPHFEQTAPEAKKGASPTSNFRAFCPSCHAVKSDSGKTSISDKRSQRNSEPARSRTKFVKSGFDAKKF